jgi:hypothetical protein
MQMTSCLSPADLAVANANIETFINLMKTEAVVLGHADRLDIETFRAAHRQLERRNASRHSRFGLFGRTNMSCPVRPTS